MESPQLDAIITAALAEGGESAHYEYKETLDLQDARHKIKLLRAIGAFCNTDIGGWILIGINDDRQVVGVAPQIAAQFDQTTLQNQVQKYFAPPPRFQVRSHGHDGKTIILIEVSPFRDVPSIVCDRAEAENQRLIPGTLLVRTVGAESAVLTTESELRRLCEAISARRAVAIAALIASGSADERTSRTRDALKLIKAEAERMADHAQNLNVALWNDHPTAIILLSRLFRVTLLENSLPQIMDVLAGDPTLKAALDQLRISSRTADEYVVRAQEKGLSIDLVAFGNMVREILGAARTSANHVAKVLAQTPSHSGEA